MNTRLATMIRGAIIPLVMKKTLALTHDVANDSGTLTLMSTDVDNITRGILILHETWACYVEIAFGLYLIKATADETFFRISVIVAGTYYSDFPLISPRRLTIQCSCLLSRALRWNHAFLVFLYMA